MVLACVEHPVAKVGERHTAPRLLHDGTADDGLHPADVLADCRLRQVQDGRSTVKSATVGDRHDAPQRCDVQDLSHPAKVLRSAIQIKDPGFCTDCGTDVTTTDHDSRSIAIANIRLSHAPVPDTMKR